MTPDVPCGYIYEHASGYMEVCTLFKGHTGMLVHGAGYAWRPATKAEIAEHRQRGRLRDLLGSGLYQESSIMLDEYVANGGRLHSKAQCKASRAAGGPKNCVIHRPSLHKLTGRPQILRSTTLIEDQCVHGVGHPNPDSAAYLNWAGKTTSWDIHGCDGCCGPVTSKQKGR